MTELHKQCCLLLLALVTIAAFSGCEKGSTGTNGVVDGYYWWATWERSSGNRPRKLIHVCFLPPKPSITVGPGAKSSLHYPGIRIDGEQLYIDGKKVTVNRSTRLFVLTPKRSLEPVKVSREILDRLSARGSLEAFNETDLWQQFIKPELEKTLAGEVTAQVEAP